MNFIQRRGWITCIPVLIKYSTFHWPSTLWMKSMLKSFIRKTRGENQQHSQRGKKFLNSRKKLEKKKKSRYWRCSPDRRSTAATGKRTILWSRKSRRLFALFVHSPLDRFVKDFTSLIYFLLFIRRVFFFLFSLSRRFCDCLLLLDVFIIIFFVLFMATRTAS